MIRKFQQGGAQDPIMQFVQALAQTLQADPQQIVQAAQQNPQALETAVQTYQQTQDINQAAQAFTEALQQQVQAARHGAKLQYLKSLKHQCAEDEELYYYKKGGSLGCGCKKKEGGEVTKAEDGAVMKFKKTIKKNNNSTKEQTYDEKTGKMRLATQAEIEQRKKNRKDASQGKGEGTPQRKNGGDLKKDCGGSKLKNGAKVCPKCGKVHSAGMGCAVVKFKAAKCGAKMKKHEQGGSLNGVPFMQNGTSKKGIQYKPDWYKSVQAQHAMFDKNGNYYEMKTKRSLNGDTFTRTINTSYSQNPVVSDTTYRYFPVKGDPEIESSTKRIYDHNKKKL